MKLILQPLIENSLFHGLEGKNGRWIIKIHAIRTNRDEILIKVMDNGVGMNEEKLARLHATLSGETTSSASDGGNLGQGIGLVNIHKRIQIYYGKQYGLTMKSWIDKGTVVTIKVPLSIREDDGHL
ncbi:ATP-binding protein [Cohnella ginsengisoli]|uniref:histidine kinase n=1 Tax=Cohnella ginsengisoli TaxID=425004 RepID=A0A9X4QNI4_9BACL|nr:ATP-binding protein [Cohnella ginsengisoli]MDG0793324.1 ATP-binding protein [Cohnella ginsengisoli]